jgi:hypothetical protein
VLLWLTSQLAEHSTCLQTKQKAAEDRGSNRTAPQTELMFECYQRNELVGVLFMLLVQSQITAKW